MRLIIACFLFSLSGMISLSVRGQSFRVISETQINEIFNHKNVNLDAGTYCLPVDFTLQLTSDNYSISGVPGKTIITSYNPADPSTNFRVQLLDTNQPDLFADGIYVVANNPYYSFGGGFKHLELPYNTSGKKVLYTQGTVLVKKNGIWERHFTGSGFHVRGSLDVKNISFDNCQFYLFSPFGKTESPLFSIINCNFNNVARVLSSSLYGGRAGKNWFNSLTEYPTNGDFRFKNLLIKGNHFSQIHTSIIWGCPPVKNVEITGNDIKNCPTTIAFFTLYQKKYGEEDYFSNRSIQLIANNNFENIVQGINSWTVTLTRTSGIATICNNRYINCSVQIAVLYGGNSLFTQNQVISENYPNQAPAPVIMVKNIDRPTHSFTKNKIIAPASIFVALEGMASIVISDNDLKVMTVFSKNNPIQWEGQAVTIEKNKIDAETLVHISYRDSVHFGMVRVRENDIISLKNFRTGKAWIDSIDVESNIIPPNEMEKFPGTNNLPKKK